MLATIYVIPSMTSVHEYMQLALEKLRAASRVLIVVTDTYQGTPEWEALAGIEPDALVPFGEGARSVFNGYKAGLSYFLDRHGDDSGPLVLAEGLAFGPFSDPADFASLVDDKTGLMAANYIAPKLDVRYANMDLPQRIPLLDFAVLSDSLWKRPDFRQFWENHTPNGDYQRELLDNYADFARWLDDNGIEVAYPFDISRYETSEPGLYEMEKLAREDLLAIIPNHGFLIDPLLSDLYTLNQRAALDTLRQRFPREYTAISRFLVKNRELRDLHATADQVEVLDEVARHPRKKKWKFGTVGVFIHAFYANMMPEFWALIERLPDNFHLYITTATDENKVLIEAFLDEKGFPADRRDVRVVEQNRGRDMGSLFISFRDVIMENRHELCLRLHSKRTPQVARQIGESFKAHLFDNLVYTNGYIRNLYDMIEEQPDLGLIMPPTIHIGFGTLGHAWFNNRDPFFSLARDMGLNVPFDSHTPLAPYGTMYWFRSKALRRMFEWRWKWEQYNPEPMHVDGGLAHVQERLIPYVVQNAGYRVVSIMNRHAAARNYAKLEYKLQRLASQIPTANVHEQFVYLQNSQRPGTRTWLEFLTPLYQKHVMTRPGLLRIVRPFAQGVRRRLLR
ncbi:rhamnan synthesis F family protein [Zhengella sp. ZM62]|uniref:rhamnan synthesis F family protein n=1 Tax=Zhengella sedimenti TaxID=3390035 RepID=UPI003976FE8D